MCSSWWHSALWALINVVKVVENKPIQDAAHVDDAKRILIRLSACYAIGFLFVNFGYSILTVSLAETLRSAEPLLRCSHRCVREKRVCHPKMLLCLVPIVMGVIRKLQRRIVFNYCSYFRHSLEYLLCGAFGADEKSRGGVHRMPIQYILSRICFGCAHAHGLSLVVEFLVLAGVLPAWLSPCYSCAHGSGENSALVIIILNALAYTLYNASSFVVLSKLDVVGMRSEMLSAGSSQSSVVCGTLAMR